MFLIILLGLVFLVGVSLFVALVGTSLLKRHAVRIPGPYESTLSKSDYGRRFEEGFQKQVTEAEKETPVSPAGPPRPIRPVLPQKSAPARGGGRWILIAVLAVVILSAFMLYGTRGMRAAGRGYRLYFCENVDFARLRPIHKSDTFTRGNITLFLKAKAPLNLKEARVVVYRLDTQQVEPYASKILPLRREWTAFSVKMLFDTIGTYSVNIYGPEEVLMAQKNIVIVPDSLAYKPVPAVK